MEYSNPRTMSYVHPRFHTDTFHDFVVAHGFGAPTEAGYVLGRKMFDEENYDYAYIAAEVVARGLTQEGSK